MTQIIVKCVIRYNNIHPAEAFYLQHSRKVVMPAGMPASSHKDVNL